MKESKTSNIVLGLIFISLGIIFLGNSLNIWDFNLFFDGWWTLYIIVPSLINIFRHGFKTSSVIGVVIGILLLLAAQDIINWSLVGKLFIPLLFIVIGFSLIFRQKIEKETLKKIKKNKDTRNYVAVFSGVDEKVNSKDYKGADCVAVFGGIDLDLRNVEIKEDIIIECVAIFGSINILLPKNINVKTSGVPIFGGADSKIIGEYKNSPTVYINYVSVFGGVEIK